jgi:hypothetical protein
MVSLSVSLISSRCVSSSVRESGDTDAISDAIFHTEKARLNDLDLTDVEGLDVFGPSLTFLYLQHNRIGQGIGALATSGLEGLRFLAIGHNGIESLGSCLLGLACLEVLDVSDNLLARLEEDALPRAIRIVSFEGNPFLTAISEHEYVARLTDARPSIEIIDGLEVVDDQDEDEEEGEVDEEEAEGTGGENPEATTYARAQQEQLEMVEQSLAALAVAKREISTRSKARVSAEDAENEMAILRNTIATEVAAYQEKVRQSQKEFDDHAKELFAMAASFTVKKEE